MGAIAEIKTARSSKGCAQNLPVGQSMLCESVGKFTFTQKLPPVPTRPPHDSVYFQAFVGHKLNEEMNNHLFCHMLLCMEGVSNPTLVRREAFTVAMAHLLKATPSERSVVFCQLASGSPSGATESQLRTVRQTNRGHPLVE